MKILFHYPPTYLSPNPKILKAFLKTLPTKTKPTKCPAKEKNEAGKAKKEGRRESEKEILLSAHARTSQADILYLDHKAAKCTTCKPVCGKF